MGKGRLLEHLTLFIIAFPTRRAKFIKKDMIMMMKRQSKGKKNEKGKLVPVASRK